MKKIFKLFSIICACATVAAPFAAAAQSGEIIKPWTTVNDFNSATFDYTSNASSATQWSLWPSTYTKVAVMKNCIAKVRDGYVGTNGETMYDGVTGAQGDKYAYFAYSENWIEPSSNKNTGYLYFNDRSKPNGGFCYGAVRYELDIRVSDLTKEDYSLCNGIQIYNANDKDAVIKMPISHSNPTTWYFSKPTGLTVSPDALNCGEWYHVTIDANYADKTVKYTAKSYKDNSTKPGFTTRSGSFTSSSPLKTSVTVQCPLYGNCSIDNVKVTKETYIVGDTNISEENSAVKAKVTVGNDVYADSNTQFGSAVDTVSPTAVLALYDSDKNLISVDYKTQKFDKHSIFGEKDNFNSDQMKELFAREIDNKTIELSLAKPSQAYTAAVYVLSDMGTLVPYGEPITFDPSRR